MIYKNWNIVTSKEYNGVVVDYVDPEGNWYSAPFRFYTNDEAESYGKICIDQSIQLKAKHADFDYSLRSHRVSLT